MYSRPLVSQFSPRHYFSAWGNVLYNSQLIEYTIRYAMNTGQSKARLPMSQEHGGHAM